ncbi:MAG: RidA family protein [Galactobacillus timonensis]|uniref:RidA family protein n=1 Tax=Galactobacillus timonensis TaxID=2041840 RepID=UPI0023EFE85C|nr:RidA family protein [Galactobacillus timonensis]MCI6068284.1 RidA family protein [Galactobacillus timonensis]MCI6755082.1 RidA family protein [Galactobacillus timonensis]MDD7086585.1 RidA family protein [Galactobacillus timonensis]MDY5221733.1 RidA family protein [Lachnospiraceae bacterium]
MNNKIYTDKAPAAIGPYSQAVQAGNILYISGMIPVDPATNTMAGPTIVEQASQIMRNIDAVLKEAGYTVDDVVKTTCFLADMNDFAKFNEVYADFFTSKPARSCVAVKQLPKGALAEVETIAIKA